MTAKASQYLEGVTSDSDKKSDKLNVIKNMNSQNNVITVAYLVWPLIILLPLVLTHESLYKYVFPEDWYDITPKNYWTLKVWPSPLGLSLGILAVIVGQFFMLTYFILRKFGSLGGGGGGDGGSSLTAIQKEGAPSYHLLEGLTTHLAQPEGFVMLGGYLTGKNSLFLFFFLSFLYYIIKI